jgi:hypothetical protein
MKALAALCLHVPPETAASILRGLAERGLVIVPASDVVMSGPADLALASVTVRPSPLSEARIDRALHPVDWLDV